MQKAAETTASLIKMDTQFELPSKIFSQALEALHQKKKEKKVHPFRCSLAVSEAAPHWMSP